MGREGAKRTDQPVGTDPAERARNGQAGRARQETARKRAGNDRPAVERILIVCPANLTFQWQRELREKFEQQFEVMRGSDIHNQFGMNQWLERPQVVTSLDLAKRQDILPGLEQVHWDLVIVDEAHRMSASDESHKSLCYRLGEKLRDSADNILLMTATPHKGDPQNFTLFLQCWTKTSTPTSPPSAGRWNRTGRPSTSGGPRRPWSTSPNPGRRELGVQAGVHQEDPPHRRLHH